MKVEKLIIGLLALFVPFALSAQEYYDDYYTDLNRPKKTRMEWGLTAGGGAWIYDTTVEMYDVKGDFGWQAGLHSSVVWDDFALQLELRYARHDVDLKPRGNAPEVNMHSNSVEVPLLFSWRPGIFRLHFGPMFRVLNDCKHTMPDGTYFDFGCVRPTMGFTVGVGVKLGRHWIIDARYNGDFTAAEGVFYSGGPEVSIREHAVQLSLGFLL